MRLSFAHARVEARSFSQTGYYQGRKMEPNTIDYG